MSAGGYGNVNTDCVRAFSLCRRAVARVRVGGRVRAATFVVLTSADVVVIKLRSQERACTHDFVFAFIDMQ